jgi:hypothetical protein
MRHSQGRLAIITALIIAHPRRRIIWYLTRAAPVEEEALQTATYFLSKSSALREKWQVFSE